MTQNHNYNIDMKYQTPGCNDKNNKFQHKLKL